MLLHTTTVALCDTYFFLRIEWMLAYMVIFLQVDIIGVENTEMMCQYVHRGRTHAQFYTPPYTSSTPTPTNQPSTMKLTRVVPHITYSERIQESSSWKAIRLSLDSIDYIFPTPKAVSPPAHNPTLFYIRRRCRDEHAFILSPTICYLATQGNPLQFKTNAKVNNEKVNKCKTMRKLTTPPTSSIPNSKKKGREGYKVP